MFVIRQMTKTDIDEALAVHLQLFEVKYTIDTIRAYLRSSCLPLLLICDDRIVGVSFSQRFWCSFCSTERYAYLGTFGILPEFRNRGLGRWLFLETCHILRKAFLVSKISLHMLRSKKDTLAFYEKLGLNIISILPGYYTFDEGHSHDGLVMGKSLSSLPNAPNRDDAEIGPDLRRAMDNPDQVSLLHRFLRYA